MRTYSVFVKEGKKWARITPLALRLESARRLFQGILLHGSMNGLNVALRPATEDYANEVAYVENKRRLFPLVTNAEMKKLKEEGEAK